MDKRQVAANYLKKLVAEMADVFPVEEQGTEEADLVLRSSAESLIVAATWTAKQRRWFLALREIRKQAIRRGWGGKNVSKLAAVGLQALNDESDGWVAIISANVFSDDPITQWECDIIHMALEQGFADEVRAELDELGLTLKDFEGTP